MAKRPYQRGQATRGSAVGRTESVPAPVGGLNAIDAISAMPPTDAVILDNFFPQTTYVELRNGASYFCTSAISGWPETLIPYANNSGTEKLFAIVGTNLYDISAGGSFPAASVTGLTNARWEYVNVSIPGGAYVYAANGLDKPLLYDGSSWVKVDGGSTPAITGVTTTTLRNPIVWKNRVWFIQTNTTKAWYLPVQAVGGAAASFDLATIWTKGGYLQSIMTFSLSSATSFDDYIGFLSSEGQLAVYQGTDPGSATTFAIVGVYSFGKPLGRRCWFKYGADAIIICSDGLVSVSRVISVGIQSPKDTISYKIMLSINQAIQTYGANFGWEGSVYPLGNKLIINVPTAELSRSYQYVMNTINDSWCTYGLLNSPWNAATFCVLGDKLYYGSAFGGTATVYLADTGRNDAGSQITGSMEPAFNYFGTNRQKSISMVRPVMLTDGVIGPLLGVNTNFANNIPSGTPTYGPGSSAVWDTAVWDTATWGGGLNIQSNWQTIGGIGFSFAPYMIVSSTTATVQLLSFDWVLQDGGVL